MEEYPQVFLLVDFLCGFQSKLVYSNANNSLFVDFNAEKQNCSYQGQILKEIHLEIPKH